MKADTFVKLLRKVIREEVQTTAKNSMVESIKPAKPTQPLNPTAFTNNNILNEILNETATNSDWRSVVNMNSNMSQGFGGPVDIPVVNSVDQMLANTRPAGDINAVKIDVVPDFSALMNKMKQDGKI